MSEKVLDHLINDLADDLEPVSRIAHPLARALPWLLVSTIYTAIVVYLVGLRPDWYEKLTQDAAFVFEIKTAAIIGVSALICSAFMAVPDMRGQKWMLAVPITVLGVFSSWMLARCITEGVYMPQMHWDHCFTEAILMTFVPAVCMVFISRIGTTTRPLMMSLCNMLAIAALGYIGLRFTCMVDTVGHACFYHLFPFVVLGTLLGFVARKLYSW